MKWCRVRKTLGAALLAFESVEEAGGSFCLRLNLVYVVLRLSSAYQTLNSTRGDSDADLPGGVKDAEVRNA